MELTFTSETMSVQNGAIIGPLKLEKYFGKDLDQCEEYGFRNEMSPLVDTCTHR